VPAAWFGFFLDLFTIITFFIFNKQRKFPTFLVGLVCCVDAIHFLRELIKGSPIPYINERFYWSNTYLSCATIYLWVSWVEGAEYILAISLAVVVYMGVVRSINISYDSNKKVCWIVLSVLAVYPIVYTCVIGAVAYYDDGYKFAGTSCGPVSSIPATIGIVQCFVAVTILVVFVCLSTRHMWIIMGGAVAVGQRRQMLKTFLSYDDQLPIRFLLIILSQLWARLAQNVYYLTIAIGTDNNAGWWSATVGVLAGYYINALVVLWGNMGLRGWLYAQYLVIIKGGKPPPAVTQSTLASLAAGEPPMEKSSYALQEIKSDGTVDDVEFV